MTILLTISPLLTLFCLLLLLLHTQALNEYVVNDDFITKNGTRVKLSLIRRYLKDVPDDQLSHMVFQFDAEACELKSHHRVIKVPTNAQKTQINKSEVYTSLEYFFKLLLRGKTSEGTFIFKKQKNLVAAWGDTLDMHSLNDINHPDIYINHFLTPKNLKREADRILFRPKLSECTEDYNLEFDIRFDKELCARYENSNTLTDAVLQLFMKESARTIHDMTCVNIRVLLIKGYCESGGIPRNSKWPSLSAMNCTNTGRPALGCDTISQDIMDTMKNGFRSFASYGLHLGGAYTGYVQTDEYRDVRLVVSGLQGVGSLAGITYRAQACSENHGYSWVSGINRIALYHEVGHMLGANHDEVGIMRANIRVGEDLMFSNRSWSEMVRFTTADPRSWCLRRKFGRLEEIVETDGWSPAISLPDIGLNQKRLTIEGMSLASLSDNTEAKHDLILGYRMRRKHKPPRLFLRIFANILTPNGSLILKTDPVNLIEIRPQLKRSRRDSFRIAAGHIATQSSTDLVILYAAHKSIRSGNESNVPYYHVGYHMSTTYGPTHWTPALPITGLVAQPGMNKLIRRDVWVGRVSSTDGADLVYAQLEKSDMGLVASYKIGFNLSRTSGKPAKWSQQYRIPGHFSVDSSYFSISVIDIDNNEKPDIVVYVQVTSRYLGTRAFHMEFIRIGKDLDKTGRVTNGWTRFKRVPTSGASGMGAIDSTSGIDDSSLPVLIALARYDNWYVSIMAGNNVLTPDLMSTGRSESFIDALNEGCHKCYKVQDVPTCISDVEHCRAQIDELNIQWSLPSKGKQTETSLRTSTLGSNKTLSEKEVSGTAYDSMFCLGFNELRKKDSGCDVVDMITVLGKGLELALADVVNKTLELALADAVNTTQITSDDIKTRSMFEDPAATSGSGLPIIAQIEIEKKVKPTLKAAIKEAERRMRNQFPSFKRVFSQRKVGRKAKSEKRKWTITYVKKKGFTDDDIF